MNSYLTKSTLSRKVSGIWMVSCATVGNRRRPIDNRPQINNLPHICVKHNCFTMVYMKGTHRPVFHVRPGERSPNPHFAQRAGGPERNAPIASDVRR